MRIGHGYDVHRLVEGRKLIIGGVLIESDIGLLGHSDADVLIHAIIDSLLGACALGDIGRHFPDTDEKYKGISSLELLKRVINLIEENNFCVVNIDSTIVAQRPKLSAYIDKMRHNISEIIGINIKQINIKATTEEGLGFTGKLEGISATAVCLLKEIYDFSDESSCNGCCCNK